MPDYRSPHVVVWEQRPRGDNWISWGFVVGIFLFLSACTAYGLFRSPLPGAYKVLVPLILVIAGCFFVVYVRRPFSKTPARITIDLEERKLYAENMIIHRAFWPPRRTPLYVCDLADIRTFRLPPSRYIRWLYIDCPAGQIRLDDVSTGFDALVRELQNHVPRGPALARKDIAVGIIAMACALVIVWACAHFGWI